MNLKFQIIPTLGEESAELTIKKVEEADVGNYTLKLSNNCGEASAELTLILMGKIYLLLFLLSLKYIF